MIPGRHSWDRTFPPLTRQRRLRWQSPLWTGTPHDQVPWELAQWDRERAAWDSYLRTPVYSTGYQMYISLWTFQMVEAREDILTGHKAKLSSHRTKHKENLIQFLTEGTHSKVHPSRPQAGENWEFTRLWGRLQRANRAYAFVLPSGFPPYDKWHERQRQEKTTTIAGKEQDW